MCAKIRNKLKMKLLTSNWVPNPSRRAAKILTAKKATFKMFQVHQRKFTCRNVSNGLMFTLSGLAIRKLRCCMLTDQHTDSNDITTDIPWKYTEKKVDEYKRTYCISEHILWPHFLITTSNRILSSEILNEDKVTGHIFFWKRKWEDSSLNCFHLCPLFFLPKYNRILQIENLFLFNSALGEWI